MSCKLYLRGAAIALLTFALSSTIAAAQDHGHGYDKHDRDDDHDRDRDRDHDRDRDRDDDHDHGRGHGYGHDRERHEGYRDHDRDIRGWYQAHYRHLPPGLAKRDRLSPVQERYLVVEGVLPVNLRTHMQPCPHELEAMLPPPPPNHIHVFIGGNLVLVNRANFQIADVFHFDIN
jgi:Ni/Co efflux regulator RcnB